MRLQVRAVQDVAAAYGREELSCFEVDDGVFGAGNYLGRHSARCLVGDRIIAGGHRRRVWPTKTARHYAWHICAKLRR